MPAFADTNVVVYAFGKDEEKVAVAEGILKKQPIISVQVINEFLNVCRIKLGMDLPTRHRLAAELIAGCNVVALDQGTRPSRRMLRYSPSPCSPSLKLLASIRAAVAFSVLAGTRL